MKKVRIHFRFAQFKWINFFIILLVEIHQSMITIGFSYEKSENIVELIFIVWCMFCFR